VLSAAAEWDGGDLVFKYSVDGTNFKAVPGMTVADNEAGYKGRFLVWGSKLLYTAANLAGSAATLAPVVTYKAASMIQSKADWTSLTAGVMDSDASSENFTFGRAPDVLLLDMEASTWDSMSAVIQGTVDGSNWFDLDGTRHTANDQYRTFNNPGGLTNFRLEWTGGGLSTVAMAIQVIGLTNQDALGIKKDAGVLATALETMTDSTGGTPDTAAPIMTAHTGSYVEATIENAFSTLTHHYNRVVVELQRVTDALQANGVLPTR